MWFCLHAGFRQCSFRRLCTAHGLMHSLLAMTSDYASTHKLTCDSQGVQQRPLLCGSCILHLALSCSRPSRGRALQQSWPAASSRTPPQVQQPCTCYWAGIAAGHTSSFDLGHFNSVASCVFWPVADLPGHALCAQCWCTAP